MTRYSFGLVRNINSLESPGALYAILVGTLKQPIRASQSNLLRTHKATLQVIKQPFRTLKATLKGTLKQPVRNLGSAATTDVKSEATCSLDSTVYSLCCVATGQKMLLIGLKLVFARCPPVSACVRRQADSGNGCPPDMSAASLYSRT